MCFRLGCGFIILRPLSSAYGMFWQTRSKQVGPGVKQLSLVKSLTRRDSSHQLKDKRTHLQSVGLLLPTAMQLKLGFFSCDSSHRVLSVLFFEKGSISVFSCLVMWLRYICKSCFHYLQFHIEQWSGLWKNGYYGANKCFYVKASIDRFKPYFI